MSEIRVDNITDEAGTGAPEITDHYKKSNILGTVSESGGVPTGAIIEIGENANGSFTKYADGTVIMSMRRSEDRSTTGVVTTTVTYPVVLSEFLSSGFGGVFATLNSTVPETATNISTAGSNSTTDIDILIDRSTTTNSVFFVLVHGRWY